MKSKIFFLIFFSVILSSYLVIGATPVYRQNTALEISHPLRIGGSVDSTISANITLRNPNNEVIEVGTMSFNPTTREHNITIPVSNTSDLGIYNYCITASGSGLNDTQCFDFEITLIGERASTSQSLVFGIVGFMSIILFLLSLVGAIKIPWKNQKRDDGFLLKINDLKYVKLLLWFVSYLLLIFLTFSFRHVSQISNWDVASKFLNGIFFFLVSFLLPIFVLTITFSIVIFFKDLNKKRLLERNLNIK